MVRSLVTGPLVGLDEKVQPAGFDRVEASQVVVSQRDVQVQPKRPIQRYGGLVCNGLEPYTEAKNVGSFGSPDG
jgi:hypothetical protein